MPEIEPFDYQKANNIDEHNQIVDKVNEIVEVINDADLDNIPQLQASVDAMETTVSTLQDTVAGQTADITAVETDVDTLQTTVGSHTTQINALDDLIDTVSVGLSAEQTTRANNDITAASANLTDGELAINLTRASGNIQATVDCPFIDTCTLIPSSTDRAFKLHFNFKDGTQYETNDFVIPDGGSGTDVSISAVTITDGTTEDSFKVSIVLDDTTTIDSNDYTIEIPSADNTYPTSVSGTGTNAQATINIDLNNSTTVSGTITFTGIPTNAVATQSTNGLMSSADKTKLDGVANGANAYILPVGGTAIGGVKNGGNVTIDASGNMTAPEVESVTASISNNQLTVNVDGVTSTPANVVASVTGSVSGNALTIGVNGVNSSPITIASSGGDEWEELTPSSLPTDFQDGDIIEITFNINFITTNTSDWNTVPTSPPNIGIGNNNLQQIISIPLTTYAQDCYIPLKLLTGIAGATSSSVSTIHTLNISQISSINSWNGSGSNQLMIMRSCTFNGAGNVIQSLYILRSGFGMYCSKIRRRRSS